MLHYYYTVKGGTWSSNSHTFLGSIYPAADLGALGLLLLVDVHLSIASTAISIAGMPELDGTLGRRAGEIQGGVLQGLHRVLVTCRHTEIGTKNIKT